MNEFKVGDWVVDKLGNHKPFQVTEKDLEEHSPQYIQKDCKQWQPRLEEWCWFYMEDHSPILMQYYGQENWDIIEPFIGTLPSFIEETK